MRILVIGQVSLHWGRMEYGNIGNYYIAEPFFRELHRVFPKAEIFTTLQMTETFALRENITVLPMDLYYGFKEDDLEIALKELAIATVGGNMQTPFIKEVLKADLVIDFSGDMWGDNADLAGKDRFLVGLIKDRVAQLLGKPTVMLAGSPGPFNTTKFLPFARLVYENFTLVTNRERISKTLMKNNGFDISKTLDLACPSFLFEAASDEKIRERIPFALKSESERTRPIIGFILCGWNFQIGPFGRTPRDDEEFSVFVKTVDFIVNELKSTVVLMSHSNGFHLPPNFELIRGRDYDTVKQLYSLLSDETKEHTILLSEILLPAETKAVIRQFDMLVSGRVHGAIAGLSQSIPTVILDYGHEPKAHKLKGFADMADVSEYICNPNKYDEITEKIAKCFNERDTINSALKEKNIELSRLAKKNFEVLKEVITN